MKNVYLIITTMLILLGACGNEHDQQLDTTKQKSKEENKKENDKNKKKEKAKSQDEHKVSKKDGVTYVDGHIFVNKKITLPKTFAPGENKVARKQLNRLISDSNKKGLDIVYRSGYRPYQEQDQLYKDYVARDGEKRANQYSAKPGQSEHQTGFAFDVGSNNITNDFKTTFGDTNEGKWIKKHAHEYGFIVRYLEDKEEVTGYQYEPWHLRYVGKDLAKTIYNKNITLEEYFDIGK